MELIRMLLIRKAIHFLRSNQTYLAIYTFYRFWIWKTFGNALSSSFIQISFAAMTNKINKQTHQKSNHDIIPSMLYVNILCKNPSIYLIRPVKLEKLETHLEKNNCQLYLSSITRFLDLRKNIICLLYASTSVLCHHYSVLVQCILENAHIYLGIVIKGGKNVYLVEGFQACGRLFARWEVQS